MVTLGLKPGKTDRFEGRFESRGWGRMYLLKEEPPEGGDSYTEGRVHKMHPLVYWVESRPTMEAGGFRMECVGGGGSYRRD